MLFTFPANLPSSDPILGNPFPAFDGGFTPWDCSELFPAVDQSPKPVTSNSGSGDFPSPKPVVSGSSSDQDRNRYHAETKTCSTDELDRPVPVVDERKRRRMISNRESARRSRMRKQKHLENLRNQVNRFRVENRELTNRLRFVSYHFQRVCTDNLRLRSEYSMLQQKLSDVRQLLLFRQLQQFPPAWPCNPVISEQTTSLIT
ncbi:hypothetical protein FNV43_RR17362 [Rhamnella rubrinervis]|uniref:BZIP domain-containing protein n=1 Tax=Rhamnella rubrinervis TaxID=2594499 RepID=A0A8K0E993_9ROSA|nr:hypothetical protein FNV43_RR17362 [Rhamnella rubrinervis]